MRASRYAWGVLLSAALMLSACEEPTSTRLRQREQAAAEAGPWNIPPETLSIGDSQNVPYTGAGPWNDGASCSPWLTEGAVELRDYLSTYFPEQISNIGGYNCRPIAGTNTLSLHGTGRALDLHIPLDGGDADNDLGDVVGNWLIENAEYIGIQYIIWDRWSWRADRAPGDKERSYGGASPHTDHLHIELSVDGGNRQTGFFQNPWEPPNIPSCGVIPPEGAIIDEVDDCFSAFGPSMFWRQVDGQGHGGTLQWTNAFENDTPSNWARWNLIFEAAGEYEVEIYTGVPEFAVYDQARYTLRYGGVQDETFIIDQSAPGEWKSLGVFFFDAEAAQFLDVYDNVLGPVAADQRITADAVRVTPYSPPPPEDIGPGDTGSPLDTSPPVDTIGPSDTSAPTDSNTLADTHVASEDMSVSADTETTQPPEDTGAPVDTSPPPSSLRSEEDCGCHVRRSSEEDGPSSGSRGGGLLLALLGAVALRRRRR